MSTGIPSSATPGDARPGGRPDRYRPIADYALIGDSRSAALISREGSIDWLCWPRFDSASVFGRLLDWSAGGHFQVRPAGAFRSRRRYVGHTNVLETTFETDSGTIVLVDLMPAADEIGKRTRLTPFRQILRRIECTSGRVVVEVDFAPRPGYGRTVPSLRSRPHAIYCEDGPSLVHLHCDGPLRNEGDRATASWSLSEGERRYLALAFDDRSPAVFPQLGAQAEAEIDATLAFWTDWSSSFTYEGPYRETVLRSALVLKMLAYAPSGAIVAAATTSLPERIGGIRNWDYRYCWLRDASFTVRALYETGFVTEGGAFVEWLMYATRLTHPHLQILYDVFGEANLPERTLDHLEGYRGSRPVRVGNDAHAQFQLDVYGEVLGAIDRYALAGELLFRDTRTLIRRLAEMVVTRWAEPDSGIWEKRSERRQHVHAKVMAWSALDCAEQLVRRGVLEADTTAWSQAKAEIRDLVLTRGFNKRLNSFVSELDGEELDASLLYIARVGFLPPGDPMMTGTIDAIRATLGEDDLIYRYTLATEDGLPKGEGTFFACSFWLVEALALSGRYEEADRLFRRFIGYGNDLSLFSEEIDAPTHELLGNFPQALTHIALMNAALTLAATRPSS
jgi:GH15 family glucan-1,4-alpha-glucosidase